MSKNNLENNKGKEKNNSLEEVFGTNFQDPKKLFINQPQNLLSSQTIPSQPFHYPSNNTSTHPSLTQHLLPSVPSIPRQPVPLQNYYIYNNGSSSIPPQSIGYSSFHTVINEADKLNQNNYQMRKLKKARLKRQKKAEYIDYLEQRISQLDRIIKQHNLTFVEPLSDSEKKPETTNTANAEPSTSAVPSNNINYPINSIDSNGNLKRKQEGSPISQNKKSKNETINSESNIKTDVKINPNDKTSKSKNKFVFENYRLDCSILIQDHTIDTNISLDLSRELFEMAENFLNIPDEISCDFYEIDKQKINFEDDEMDIFYRPNDVKLTPDGRNKSNLCYDSSDPFGLFSCSFCNNYHVTYKVLTKTEDFNDFVVELMKLLFIYCSYFPPDDLVDLQLLRKDLSSHNLFMIFSLCSYGLLLIPYDMPYNVGPRVQFIENCIKSCPAENPEDFYYKYIKDKEITYKHLYAMSDVFYRESLKYHFFDGPIELYTIEGYLSLSLYKCLMGDPYLSWEYLGIAIRYGDAFNLNSYVDNENGGVEKIISKRLWWKCYVFDIMASKMIGTEGFFNNSRIDKFKRDQIDYYNDMNNSNRNNIQKSEIGKDKNYNNFLILHRMVRIWKKASKYTDDKINQHLNHNYFYSLHFAKPGYSLFKKVNRSKEQQKKDVDDEFESTPILDPAQELLKLEVKHIWDSIPELFKRLSIINSSINPNIFKLMASFHILYYSIIIHIYRPKTLHRNFQWTKGYNKNSYNRMVCLQSAQRTARFIYYYLKLGIMDLIPNAIMFPIFESVTVILDDFKAEENLSKKRPLKVNYEEKKKKLLMLNIFIIFYYHRAKHQINANVMLKLILDFVKENNIPTILHESN